MVTNNPQHDPSGPTDAELVAASLGGDRQALGVIYDRYADPIHTMCVHMLGDRDEAADVCGEVFLVAFQRLDQLRDPNRLRPWLYAICRHEVFKRTKRRKRVRLVEEVSEMERLSGHTMPDDDDVTDAGALAAVVREAAAGLDDRDRMVLELQLQGVEGDDLAAALGSSASTTYQHVHRMRERMERSVGALLVARQGRRDCAELDGLLAGWDGAFSVLWRKRVARHVDGCDVCERRRKAVPAALLGTAGASPLVVTPTSVRTRVLAEAVVASGASRGGGGRWRGDGFPPGDPEPRRRALAALVAGVVLLLVGGLAWAVVDDDPATIEVVDRVDATTTSSTSSSTTSSSVVASTTVATTVPSTTAPLVVDTTIVAPTTTRAIRPTTVPATTAPPTRVPPTTSPPTSTTTSTTTTTVAPPTLRLTGPSALYARAANGGTCSNQAFTATITSSGSPSAVTLRWTAGAATGSVAMTRNRLRGTWNAVVDLPFGTNGAVTLVAEATAGGATGRSNTLTAVASPCPVIG